MTTSSLTSSPSQPLSSTRTWWRVWASVPWARATPWSPKARIQAYPFSFWTRTRVLRLWSWREWSPRSPSILSATTLPRSRSGRTSGTKPDTTKTSPLKPTPANRNPRKKRVIFVLMDGMTKAGSWRSSSWEWEKSSLSTQLTSKS